MERITGTFTSLLGIKLCGVRPDIDIAPCHSPRYENPIHSTNFRYDSPLWVISSLSASYQAIGCLRARTGHLESAFSAATI